MANRLCDTEIWEKDWFLELNTKQKLLVKFLFDKCDCAGFYKISWNLLKVFFNDVEITREDFEQIKQVKFIDKDLVFVEDFALFQCKISSFDKLNPNNNAHKGVLKLLEKHNIFLAPPMGLVSPIGGAQEKEKDKDITSYKQIDTSSKLYGKYQNVNLSKEHFGKLLSMCASDKLLNELIDSFSINIEVGKERPYIADLPNAHYERLKSYYNYRKKNPLKFQKETTKDNRPEYNTKIVSYELSDQEREEAEKTRIKLSELFKNKKFGKEMPL